MLEELVRKSRSYRGYNESVKVSREQLLQLVECARMTPAAMNAQPLKYYLATQPADLQAIQSLTGWAGALPKLSLPHPGHCPTAFIIICQDTKISDSATAFLKDVGIVAQTMLLRATEMGLGGCMIGNFHAEQLRQALKLNESMIPQLVVAVGKPDETIILTDVGDDGKTAYYRDGQDVHYVPKRSLQELVLN